jgi:hypothetical protein
MPHPPHFPEIPSTAPSLAASPGEGVVAPLVSLTRTQSITALVEQASKDLPVDQQDGLSLAVVMRDDGVTVRGSVVFRDLTGTVAYSRAWTGAKELDATITWRF